ncbi:MAG: hypothetical protein KAS23_02145 [Anaerohalosphaera sp.]|nr:hypothetical protein [Anaerohalosphaera sp.]
MNKTTSIIDILNRTDPGQFVYAPNYWQWFAHHSNHGTLPEEIANCQSQLDMIGNLGLDVFSRNIYSNQNEYWFGGLCREVFENAEVTVAAEKQGNDTITTKTYSNSNGELKEELRYVFNESTVVQQKFLIDDYVEQQKLLVDFVHGRRWEFLSDKFQTIQRQVGSRGVVVAGELYSPLKMLHLLLGPVNTTYLIMDQSELVDDLVKIHEQVQLDLALQMARAGVKVMMAMDNLDTMFHPPQYVEKYSASFYEKASRICHEYDGHFFIHACGQQKDNLKLIASLGVDGLEGIAYPPLGDVSLAEAMQMTGDKFILTGGISAAETKELTSRQKVFDYVQQLFRQMLPYRNRFILSASCNTAIDTPYKTICWFRDAWQEYKEIDH